MHEKSLRFCSLSVKCVLHIFSVVRLFEMLRRKIDEWSSLNIHRYSVNIQWYEVVGYYVANGLVVSALGIQAR